MRSYTPPPAIRRVLAGLVPVICPPEVVELGLVDGVVDHVAGTMSTLPPLFLRGLHAGLRTYDHGARLRYLRPAHRLTGEAAERYFQSWLHGATIVQRQLAMRLRQMMAMAYYEQPAVLDRMGYTPQAWIDDVTRRRLAVYGEQVAAAATRITAPDPLRPTTKTEVV
jgi:hypothetical protein